uniref:Uncharacterized protein n=1 Tax=Bionectria ochroleuca TaxID=29856 RepID=A0A8H7NHW0_BIOOC
MLARFCHGPAPQLARLLGRTYRTYPVFQSSVTRTAARPNARTFTTARMCMAKAKPKPEDETGTPEKKPRKSRKASEAVPENGADESTPKKKRAAKKTPKPYQKLGLK